MARTTSDNVKAILLPGRDYDTANAPSLAPFIDTASAIVDDVVTCLTRKGLTLSATRLELIERWLAAHVYQQSDQGYASRSTEGASASFQGQTAMYLEGTKYGQMALSLETNGCLAAIASGKGNARARGFWLGKTRSNQLEYDDGIGA